MSVPVRQIRSRSLPSTGCATLPSRRTPMRSLLPMARGGLPRGMTQTRSPSFGSRHDSPRLQPTPQPSPSRMRAASASRPLWYWRRSAGSSNVGGTGLRNLPTFGRAAGSASGAFASRTREVITISVLWSSERCEQRNDSVPRLCLVYGSADRSPPRHLKSVKSRPSPTAASPTKPASDDLRL